MELKTLANSLKVLEAFTEEYPSWGVRDLAKSINMSSSIVHRILSTYENYGFLQQDKLTKKYSLGVRFIGYAALAKKELNISEYVVSLMKELAHQTNESIFLTLLDGDSGTTAEIAESSQPIKFAVNIGTRTPIHAGASCKVMLAYLPEEQLHEVLHKEGGLVAFTAKTKTEQDELLEDLRIIKQQGWCYSTEEFSEGVFGLGLPLFNYNHEIIASLTMAGPIERLPIEKIDIQLSKMRKTASAIQKLFSQHGVHYTP